MVCNMGPDSGTTLTASSFAHDIFFATDLYSQTKSSLYARVGMHLDFFPAEAASDPVLLKDFFNSMGNFKTNLSQYVLQTCTVSNNYRRKVPTRF